MNNKYGILPAFLGTMGIDLKEMCFYQYLPVKMALQRGIYLPDTLKPVMPLISAVVDDLKESGIDYYNHYFYLTVKRLYVEGSYSGNRGGYHSDGFMTDDLNYIWADRNPTVFCQQSFDITQDHNISLREFEQQALKENEVIFPDCSLLKLDQFVVHKVADRLEAGFRTFIKLSVSKNQYNLVGNSHNYLIDYKWEMHERAVERNEPSK